MMARRRCTICSSINDLEVGLRSLNLKMEAGMLRKSPLMIVCTALVSGGKGQEGCYALISDTARDLMTDVKKELMQ